MAPAPLEYTPEWHDEVNLSIHSRIGEIRDSVKRFDSRQFWMLMSAIAQLSGIAAGLIFVVLKFG